MRHASKTKHIAVVLTLASFVSGGLLLARELRPETPPDRNQVRVDPAPQAPSASKVVFGPKSKCNDATVNAFVSETVERCAAGDYDAYRLMWTIDYRPASRKRFRQLAESIEQIEVKLVKQLQIESADGAIEERDDPVYVCHVFVKINPDIQRKPGTKFEDRDLILLITRNVDSWQFEPAPDFVKDALLASAKDAPSESLAPSRSGAALRQDF